MEEHVLVTLTKAEVGLLFQIIVDHNFSGALVEQVAVLKLKLREDLAPPVPVEAAATPQPTTETQ